MDGDAWAGAGGWAAGTRGISTASNGSTLLAAPLKVVMRPSWASTPRCLRSRKSLRLLFSSASELALLRTSHRLASLRSWASTRSASSTTASETGCVLGSSRKVLVASVEKAPVRVWL